MMLAFTLSLMLHADDRTWGVTGASAPNPMACANFLRGNDDPNQAKLALAKRRAEARLRAITRAADEVEATLRPQMREVARAVEAAVTKHHHVFATAKDLRKLDYQRHLAILETSAAFDEKRPVWSLYQIERVVQTRHSILEYADCVDDDAPSKAP